MQSIVTLRPLQSSDGPQAALVFFNAVHVGCADIYTSAQRSAWAGDEPDQDGWSRKINGMTGVVAEADGQMLGFMTLDKTGLIDLAFVRSDVIGHGIGRQLYAEIEILAQGWGLTSLRTEASLHARPFFEALGWDAKIWQHVEKNGVTLANIKMTRAL